MGEENWIAGAVEALAGGAKVISTPMVDTPRQKTPRAKKRATGTGRATQDTIPRGRSPSQPDERAIHGANANSCPPAHPDSAEPIDCRTPSHVRSADPSSPASWDRCKPSKERAGETEFVGHLSPDAPVRSADEPNLAGQTSDDAQHEHASQTELGGQVDNDRPVAIAPQPESGGGHAVGVPHSPVAAAGPLIPRIVEEWRRCQDLLRSRQRIELQAKAICRRFVDGDKEKGAALYVQIAKDPAHLHRAWLSPYLMAMEPLVAARADIMKTLEKLARELPVYEWAKSIKGLGDYQLAAIIGECGGAGDIGPGDYKSVSALWKRMGLAVINGGRQRRVQGADALDHGYNAERRSLMWNIGGSLMKAQLRSEKDEKGKKIEGTDYAIGDFGQVYLDRKNELRAKNEAGEYAERAAKAVAAAKKLGNKPLAENVAGRLTPSHIHNDAKRYMEKRLLRHLWQEWRRAISAVEANRASPAAELEADA